jgi:hypothetical protein
MKTQRTLVALTVVNAILFAGTVAWRGIALAQEAALPVLRGRGLEIVDERGRVRASISVMPAGTSPAGDRYPETVLLRLITEQGRPAVKLSATEQASGMSLAGPTGTRNTWVIVEARGAEAAVRLHDEAGGSRELRP